MSEKKISVELNKADWLMVCEALERTMHHYSTSIEDGKEDMDSFHRIYKNIYDTVYNRVV